MREGSEKSGTLGRGSERNLREKSGMPQTALFAPNGTEDMEEQAETKNEVWERSSLLV